MESVVQNVCPQKSSYPVGTFIHFTNLIAY